MAEYKYIGTEPRVFREGLLEGVRPGAVGSAKRPAEEGDVVTFAGMAERREALDPDLVPNNASTRRQAQLIRDQVRIADARQFAPGTPKSGGR